MSAGAETAAPNEDAPAKPVSTLELAAFAAPAAPLLALALPTIIFLPPYYAAHLGLPLAAVSAIFLLARVLDIVLDPFIGGLQDRTLTPWGRRKLWLAGGTPVLMLAVWFAFIGLPAGAPITLGAAAALALYICFAAANIAHLSWAGEIAPSYHGRTRTLGFVQAASMIGQVGMLMLAAFVVQGQGRSDADAVHAMGWWIIAALPLCVGLAVLIARERRTPPQQHLTLRDSIDALRRNPTLRRVLAPDFLIGAAQGISGGLFLFYFQHVLGFAREAQTLLFVYFLAGLFGVPIWMVLGRRFGKHRAMQIGCCYIAATTAPLAVLPPGVLAPAVIAMVLAGIGQGASVLLLRAMMADVVDEDELSTGARRSGLFFGLLLTTTKVGLAMGPLSYALLGAAGFNPAPGAANSDTALSALTALFIGGPITLTLLAAALLRDYPLDEKRQAALALAIDARHAANKANTRGPSTR